MSRYDDLTYISDSLLIRKLELINYGIRKEAGVLSGSGLEGSILSWGKEHIDTSSTMSIIQSLAKLMEPAVLFSINPLLGVLDSTIQELTGYSLVSVVARIFTSIFDKLKGGESINSSEVNSAAGISSEGYFDFFSVIRDFEKRGELVVFMKCAAGGSNWLASIFKNLFAASPVNKRHGLLFGLAAWIVKTILKGAGLLALTGGIASLVGLKKHEPEAAAGENYQQHEDKQSKAPKAEAVPYLPNPIAHSLKASGRGEDTHKNDSSTSWWAPISGSVDRMLLDWAQDVYPELGDHDKEIKSSISYNRLANVLRNYVDGGYVEIPKGLTDRKQVVDLFAGEVAKELKG